MKKIHRRNLGYFSKVMMIILKLENYANNNILLLLIFLSSLL